MNALRSAILSALLLSSPAWSQTKTFCPNSVGFSGECVEIGPNGTIVRNGAEKPVAPPALADAKETMPVDLRQAISFILKGDLKGDFLTIDYPKCIYQVRGGENLGIYYLNNVELKYTKVYSKTYLDGRTSAVLELNGSQNVYGLEPYSPVGLKRAILEFPVVEEKLLNALRYVYSHGCKGAEAPF